VLRQFAGILWYAAVNYFAPGGTLPLREKRSSA